ncbi:MAG: hypothetical protein RIC55_30455 [Pirellulaceae bacterium]
MTEEQDLQADDKSPDTDKSKKKTGLMSRLLHFVKHNWIAAFIFVLVLIHAGLFAAWKLNSGGPPPPTEHTLGEFSFEGAPLPGNPVSHAEFRLHISLLDGARYRGVQLLAQRRHKLQQEIEELLRQAHGADFEDPTLAELKRQIQAIVNRTLGEHVVNEVIITDLNLERVAAASPLETPDAAQATPWREANSG